MMSPPIEYSLPSTSIVLFDPISPAFDAGLSSTTVIIKNPNESFSPNTFAVSGQYLYQKFQSMVFVFSFTDQSWYNFC